MVAAPSRHVAIATFPIQTNGRLVLNSLKEGGRFSVAVLKGPIQSCLTALWSTSNTHAHTSVRYLIE